MKVNYAQDVDALTILFKQGAEVAESDEAKPGVILDYDADGNLVSIEVLNASEHMPDVRTLEFSVDR